MALDLREPRLAVPLLLIAPLPVAIGLAATAKPDYPEDSCYYGAPAASLRATEEYLALQAPLAMAGLVLVATVGLPAHGRWRLLAPALAAWSVGTLVWHDASRPLMIVGAYLAVFGIFLAVPALVVAAVAARSVSWPRALAWLMALYVLPVMLGLAGLLAQPACYTGDPPAPIPQ